MENKIITLSEYAKIHEASVTTFVDRDAFIVKALVFNSIALLLISLVAIKKRLVMIKGLNDDGALHEAAELKKAKDELNKKIEEAKIKEKTKYEAMLSHELEKAYAASAINQSNLSEIEQYERFLKTNEELTPKYESAITKFFNKTFSFFMDAAPLIKFLKGLVVSAAVTAVLQTAVLFFISKMMKK